MKRIVIISTMVLLAVSCSTSNTAGNDIPTIPATHIVHKATITPSPQPSHTETMTPTVVWPLTIPLSEAENSMEFPEIPCNHVMTIKPGKHTLEDVLYLLGPPIYRRDFQEGIALGYPTMNNLKFNNIVLIDPETQNVLLLALVGCDRTLFEPECLTIDCYQDIYGEPIPTVTNHSRDHLFFSNSGLALLVSNNYDPNAIFGPIQYLSPNITIEEYILHNGYFAITFAFTP